MRIVLSIDSQEKNVQFLMQQDEITLTKFEQTTAICFSSRAPANNVNNCKMLIVISNIYVT